MFMAAFFFRRSRSVFSIGGMYDVYDADDRPDDAEISRSSDARFRHQSDTPIHKS
jgi:hypothetical protein